MSHRVVLATRNAHKIDEVRRILAPLVDSELVESPDLTVAAEWVAYAVSVGGRQGSRFRCIFLLGIGDNSHHQPGVWP